jgi:uncharacterized protein (DUF2384 family)
MKKIKLLVEFNYSAEDMHDNTKESIDWFFKYILGSKRKDDLVLHSNEIGDEIGVIKVLKIIK